MEAIRSNYVSLVMVIMSSDNVMVCFEAK